jgi:hypothetical protein
MGQLLHIGRRRTAFVAAIVAATTVIASMSAGYADPPSSTLVASTAAVTLDIGGPTSAGVTVGLDPTTCLNVFNNGQTYTVAAVSGNTSTASVSPANSAALHCSTAAPTFTISVTPQSCAALGSTTIDFTPVAGPPGIQDKLHGTSVAVTVTDQSGLCTSGGGGTTGGGGVPAAPAVANAYLDASPAVTAACQAAFGTKSWRGNLISFIAGWMPKPESVKDNSSIFGNGQWVDYVTTEVNHKCHIAAPDSFDPTPFSVLTPYTP